MSQKKTKKSKKNFPLNTIKINGIPEFRFSSKITVV